MKRTIEENEDFRVESETTYYLIDKKNDDNRIITSNSLKNIKMTWNKIIDDMDEEMEAEE